MLLFYVDHQRYACKCDMLVEVLPVLSLHPIAHAPPFIAGILQYRQGPVPVIDFTQLRIGRPSDRHLSTRIVIALLKSLKRRKQWMGLIVERATTMIELKAKDFTPSEMLRAHTPYLTGVYTDDKGAIEQVDLQVLFEMVHLSKKEASHAKPKE